MNDTLDDLASSIGGAHEAVDRIADHVADRGDAPSDWRVGLTDEPLQTTYDDEPETDGSVISVETASIASAEYALRELSDRGFRVEEIDSTNDGRIVYAHEIDGSA